MTRESSSCNTLSKYIMSRSDTIAPLITIISSPLMIPNAENSCSELAHLAFWFQDYKIRTEMKYSSFIQTRYQDIGLGVRWIKNKHIFFQIDNKKQESCL